MNAIRAGRPNDVPAVVDLVRGLAAFEKLEGPGDAEARRLGEHAFGPERKFELLVCEVEGVVRAYAAYFFTYSTFRARPGLHLEDLYVHQDVRGRGIGRALMRALAEIAVDRGCARFEWTVLDWNEHAQRFYRQLGATILPDWKICRMDGEALERFASRATS